MSSICYIYLQIFVGEKDGRKFCNEFNFFWITFFTLMFYFSAATTPKDCSPTLSPLNAFSRSMDNSSLSRSVEQLSSPLESEPRRNKQNTPVAAPAAHSRSSATRGGTWGSISRWGLHSLYHAIDSTGLNALTAGSIWVAAGSPWNNNKSRESWQFQLIDAAITFNKRTLYRRGWYWFRLRSKERVSRNFYYKMKFSWWMKRTWMNI